MTRTNREVYQVFQAIDREPQYQGLTAEFVLRNIPRGLCTHHEDSAWLSCRFCERRGQRLKLPNEMGVTNHFAQSRHNNAEADPEAAAASPERPSMWSTQPRPASTQPPPEPVPDTPPPWLPPAAVTGSGRNGPTVATMNTTTPTDPSLQAPSSIGSPAQDQPIPTRRQQLMQWAGQGPDTPAQVGSASMRAATAPAQDQPMPEPMSEPPPTRPPQPTAVVDAPSSRGDVKYQGPVETTTLISYTAHPSPEEEAALPRRDRIVQICQKCGSDNRAIFYQLKEGRTSTLLPSEFPDIIQFSSAVHYCNEAEGKVEVEVSRLGEDDNQCHVDYETFDISAVSGVKYVGRKGTIAFEPGQMPHWSLASDCSGLAMLFSATTCTPAENADKLREDRAAEIQPVVLWSEYLKMSLKDRKVKLAATYNLLTDQVRNLAYLWQVMLTKYLIDQVLADEPQPFFTDPIMPRGREERVWLTIAFSFVPHAVMLVLNRLKAERRIQGMVVNQLQGRRDMLIMSDSRSAAWTFNVPKFLNYNGDSRDSVSTSDLAMAITRDVPELVEHGFMGIFELVENLGLVIVLGILMLAQSQLSPLTPICFFLIPLAMLSLGQKHYL
eukprot:s563_g10.t1